MGATGLRVSLPGPGPAMRFLPYTKRECWGLWNHLIRDLCDPVNLAGELGGMCVLGYLWRWCGLSNPIRRAYVWKTGVLAPMPGRKKLLGESPPPRRGRARVSYFSL